MRSVFSASIPPTSLSCPCPYGTEIIIVHCTPTLKKFSHKETKPTLTARTTTVPPQIMRRASARLKLQRCCVFCLLKLAI
jgi:hypothetical protein